MHGGSGTLGRLRRGLRIGLLALLAAGALAAAASAQTDPIAELNSRISELYGAGRYAEALPLAERAVEVASAQHGAGSKEHAIALYRLGNLLIGTSRYGEAEAALRRAVGVFSADPEARLEAERARQALGTALVYLNKMEEGLGLMRGSADALAALLGPDHPQVVVALNNLAHTLHAAGRAAEAEPIYRRLIAGLDADKPENAFTLGSLHANLAGALQEAGRREQALAEMRRALELLRRVGNPDHPFLAIALNNLGFMELAAGRRPEAGRLFREALGIIERTTGKDDQGYATALLNLATAIGHDEPAEAGALARTALATLERTLGPEHPKTVTALNQLAVLLGRRGQWTAALALHDRASEAAVRHAFVSAADGQAATSSVYPVHGADFLSHMRAIHRVAPDDPARRDQAFRLLQRSAGTRTAAAVSQMAARVAAEGGALSELVRQEQDLARRRTAVDRALVAALGARGEDEARRTQLREELAQIDAELARLGGELSRRFPEYATLTRAEPLPIAALQRVLRADEALVGFIEVPGEADLAAETHAWVVTREEVHWRRLDLPAWSLWWGVQGLRCGLDTEAWQEEQGRENCRQLTGASGSPAEALPFSLYRAYQLYQQLLEPFERELRTPDGRWRHLLVVAAGPLSILPLHTLVTEPPDADLPGLDGYRNVKWLGTRQQITVLPSVASLATLRLHAKASRARQPFIGFGNPLLTGRLGRDRSAWERLACPAPGATGAVATGAAAPARQAGRDRPRLPRRGGLANVEEVRRAQPLPETADELCAVARATGAGEDAVNLGERATEARVKALSEDGTLAGARIVHFATHGLLAGETEGLASDRAEPSLMLTPPAAASERDDGLLTASEIAALKLDADWVILSACNTAASDRAGAEAFSGLARAFFYAGARALLVSHWYVDSDAAVRLVTGAFAELGAAPTIGRAEAMRRAIAKVVASGGRFAHPASWAPFVVVGEGAGTD